MKECFACGGLFEPIEGPVHDYMLSTPGCWHAYARLLAREYQDKALFAAAHRYCVDAYALQHPGNLEDRRARQSVWVHYIALYLAFETRLALPQIPALMQKSVTFEYPVPGPKPDRFDVTHADLLAADLSRHAALARDWARCAFDAWENLQEDAREFAARVL